MYHQHFNTIASTQIYLKDNLGLIKQKENNILISCSEQTEGIGRRGNSWNVFPNSLALSFTLKPNAIASLTPIEIGLITIDFFKKKFNKELFLKWPNDILTIDGKKCGGIICQYIDHTTVIVGLGLNLGKFEIPIKNNFKHGVGSVDLNLELKSFDQEKISNELYLDFLSERISESDIIKNSFSKSCAHLNKEVFIFEDGEDHVGIFRGIGDKGEALVEINSTLHRFISSSLTILN
jgi:BirA family biotin operon repressor/biotin-[acetyl-CoA-carboxylase] ligase